MGHYLCHSMIATHFGRCWLRSVRSVCSPDWPDGPAVFAIWHEDALFAAALFRPRHSMALVSLSRDGQFLADMLAGGRLDVVRGSSHRGGVAASRAILRGLADGRSLVTALDGPKGPAFRAKDGPAWLARHAGVPLFLLRFTGTELLRARDWSRLRIPVPFSRSQAILEPLAVSVEARE